MKVLIAHNRYRIRGGEDVVAERETRLLEESGCQVVRYFRDSDEISGPVAALKVAVRLPGSGAELARFGELLAKERPDVVHVHNFFPLLTPAVFAACRRARVPVVHTLHNFRLFCANGLMLREGRNCELCLERASSWPGVRHGCYRNSSLLTLPMARLIERGRGAHGWAADISAFLCTTEFARGKFLQYGLPEERLHVKPNFSPDLAERFERREGDYALYLGRLSEEKGIRTLLGSWSGLKEKLVFVGDGPLAGEVRASGHTLHQGLGQEEAFRLLAGCRFLVMPSECYESGIPLVLLEAMSLRVPVISSRFGAADEVFRSEENALIFPPGNGNALRQAVEHGIKEESKRRQWAEAARKVYEEKFHPRQNLARLLQIYQSAAEGSAESRFQR